MSGYNGFRDVQDTGSDHAALSFLVTMMINRIATTTLAKVITVQNAGALAPVGFLNVQPMIHQVDGEGNPTPHGVIHNVPYFRLQGGRDAVIIDPKINDIGIVVFGSRDLTAVKRTKSSGNPGSRRMYDWADALYIGGVLNGTPTQYFRFSSTGVEVVSPTNITLTAPTISLNGNTSVTGSMTATQAVVAGLGGADQVGLQSHRHGVGTSAAGTVVPTPGL